jgi:hypothetical protein
MPKRPRKLSETANAADRLSIRIDLASGGKIGPGKMLDWEEQQRARRSLERRLSAAHIGRFKPLCDFDWTWPKHCDRAAVDALITLDFLKEAANVVFVGPNGVGKSMFAQNIAHQAVIDGHTVLFTSAGQLRGDLCALDSDSTLQRRLRHYARPQLLVIDEVGYLSYSNRHADMLFQLVSRRIGVLPPSSPPKRFMFLAPAAIIACPVFELPVRLMTGTSGESITTRAPVLRTSVKTLSTPFGRLVTSLKTSHIRAFVCAVKEVCRRLCSPRQGLAPVSG